MGSTVSAGEEIETALINVHQIQQRAFDQAAPGREIQQVVESFFGRCAGTVMSELPPAAVEHLREAARLAPIIVGGEMRQCEQAAVQEFLVRLHIKLAEYDDDDDDRDTIMNHACRLLAQEFATTRH